MSIPGLGQIPTQQQASAQRTITLQPLWEWRFEVPFGTTGVTVRLVSGTAERDGTELALNQTYHFLGTKSKLLTWTGATLDIDGLCDDYVAEHASPDETPMVSYLNLHLALQARRAAAAKAQSRGGYSGSSGGHLGPRVLIAGPASSGKTSLARTLAALATRCGGQPLVVNADPREGMLSLPGTLGAAVFGTIMDVESGGGAWGGAPTTGPGAVPVKLPLVQYLGRERAEDDATLYRTLVAKLAGAVTTRMAEDTEVGCAGCVIDSPTVNMARGGVDMLAHIVEEFSVNIIIVLGSARMNSELVRRFASEKTSLGEPTTVVLLDKSEGVVERDEGFLQLSREAVIKEYFFGDAKRTLSPFTQQIDFDGMVIYKAPEPSEYLPDEEVLERVEPEPSMAHWTLAVMNASIHDSPEAIQHATVMGFVYVADVDTDRRKLKILAPVSGRLGDRPVIWGRWPEPYINLLG